MQDTIKARRSRAQWAARLMCEPTREFTTIPEGPDHIEVIEVMGEQPVASTITTEPLLLDALVERIRWLRANGLITTNKEEQT